MKSILTFIAILSLTAISFAATITLTTNDGKKHTGTISSIAPDGITLLEDSGVEKLQFSNLPVTVQKKYGFDAKKAAQFQKAEANAAIQREQNLRKFNILQTAKSKKYEAHEAEKRAAKIAQEKKDAASRPKTIGGLVNLIGRIFEVIPDSGAIVQLNSPTPIAGREMMTMVFVANVGGWDGDVFNSKAVCIGNYSYENEAGSYTTIPKMELMK